MANNKEVINVQANVEIKPVRKGDKYYDSIITQQKQEIAELQTQLENLQVTKAKLFENEIQDYNEVLVVLNDIQRKQEEILQAEQRLKEIRAKRYEQPAPAPLPKKTSTTPTYGTGSAKDDKSKEWVPAPSASVLSGNLTGVYTDEAIKRAQQIKKTDSEYKAVHSQRKATEAVKKFTGYKMPQTIKDASTNPDIGFEDFFNKIKEFLDAQDVVNEKASRGKDGSIVYKNGALGQKFVQLTAQLKQANPNIEKGNLQDLFESLYNEVAAAIEVDRTGSTYKGEGYTLTEKGFKTFFKDGKIIPSIKKNMDGAISPNSTVKIYDEKDQNGKGVLSIPESAKGTIKNDWGENVYSLSGMSLRGISQIIQDIEDEIFPIEKEAKKNGQEVPQRVADLRNFITDVTNFITNIAEEASNTAINGKKISPAQSALIRQINSQDYDTGEYYNQSQLYGTLRARVQKVLGTNEIDDFHAKEGTTYIDKEEEKRKQNAQEENKRVQTGLTGKESVQLSSEIQSIINGILSPALIESVKATIKTQGVDEAKDLITEALGSLRDGLGIDEKLDLSKLNLDINGDREYLDLSETERGNNLEEVNKQKIKIGENINKYFDVIAKLLGSLNQELEKESDETLKSGLSSLKDSLSGRINRHNAKNGAIVEGVNDTSTLANALSNFVTIGGSITEASSKYASASGISEQDALKKATKPLSEDMQYKIAESIKAKNAIDEFLKNASDSFKNELGNIDDKTGELDSIKDTVLNLGEDSNIFEYILGLKRQANAYLVEVQDFNQMSQQEQESSGLQSAMETKQKFIDLTDKFLIDTQKGLNNVGNNVGSKQLKDILKSVNTFSSDLTMFSEFMRKFYQETYEKGQHSFNYEEGSFDINDTDVYTNRSDRTLFREEVTPKENYLSHTKGLDVLAPYGAGAGQWDQGVELAEKRLEELRSERENLLAKKQKAAKEFEKIQKEEADADAVIQQMAGKYMSHTDKNGKVKIDWKKSYEHMQEYSSQEIAQDRRAYEKALSVKRGLKTGQVADIKKDATVDDNVNLQEIEVVESDIEYMKYRIGQLNELKKKEEEREKVAKQQIEEEKSLQEQEQKTDQAETETILEETKPKKVRKKRSKKTKEQSESTEEFASSSVPESQTQEQKAFQQTNETLDEHVDKVDEATEAEKNKFIISEKLAKQLANEEKMFDSSTESIQDHAEALEENNKQSEIKATSFKVNYVEDKNKGIHQYFNEKDEQIMSSTQLRDILLNKQNPMFKEDINRIKAMADNASESNPLTAQMAGMSDKDFKFYTENVIGAGKRGDLFHNLIDKMVGSGSTTLDELEKNDAKAFQAYQEEYQKTVQELAKYGIGEEFLDIQGRLESYMDAMKKSGLSATKFSEQHLGLRLNGPRGAIDIGVTPDQLYGGSGFGAFIDNKTGFVTGLEAFQLTAQKLASLANFSNPDFKDMFGDVSENDLSNAKGYIADVEEGTTTLREYMMLTLEEFYNLAKDAEDIVNGKREPLSEDEIKSRMNRQLHTGMISGYRDSYYDGNGNFIGPPDNGNGGGSSAQQSLNEYINTYKQLKKAQTDVYEIQKKIEEAISQGNNEEVERLKLQKEERIEVAKNHKEHLKGLEQYQRGSSYIDANGRVVINGASSTYNGQGVSQDVQRRAYYRLEDIDRQTVASMNAIKNSSDRREEKYGNSAQTKAMREQMAILTRINSIDLSIASTQKDMTTQNGAQKRDSEAVLQSLNKQKGLLTQRLAQYNQETGKLGEIELSEENRIKFNEQLNQQQAQQDTKLRQINTEYQKQNGLISQIVGGFKGAFTHIFDANLAYQAIGYVKQGIRQVIQSTKELDKSLSDIQIATGQTRSETRELLISYTDLGKELGRTTQSVAQASNDWLRAGYQGKEAAELTKASMMLSTLGMIDASEATTYLISTLKGWKMEANEVIGVVDALTVIICGVCLVISIGHKSKSR